MINELRLNLVRISGVFLEMEFLSFFGKAPRGVEGRKKRGGVWYVRKNGRVRQKETVG